MSKFAKYRIDNPQGTSSNRWEKYKITQVKSTIDRTEDQKRTVRALGFTKLNQSREVVGTPQVMGMIHKVAHLLKVEKI